ncbi:unnamed protein product, partial [Ectocarpus sp. 12 AP-2014]
GAGDGDRPAAGAGAARGGGARGTTPCPEKPPPREVPPADRGVRCHGRGVGRRGGAAAGESPGPFLRHHARPRTEHPPSRAAGKASEVRGRAVG